MDHCMKNRRLYRTLTSLFCGILICSCAFSTAVYAEGHDSDTVRTIRVGFFSFDGYHMISSSGRRSGYGYDFLQEIGRYTDWKYKYVGYDSTWSEMQEMLEEGKIDILTSAQKTEEREKKFDFSDESIGTSAAILTVKSGDTRFTAGDYPTYNGMVVGQLKNSSRNDSLKKYAREKGFTYIGKYYDDTDEMKAALQRGEVNALLTSNLRVISDEWILDQFDSSDFYVMVRKGNTELLDQINDAVSKLDTYYPDWRSELWKKYYLADSGDAIPFTADEREYIKDLSAKGEKLTAIVEPDRTPYSYFKDGKACGIMPEVFARIEELTGIHFNIIEADDRNDYFSKVQGKEHIDVCVDSPADFYQAEEAGFKLTDSYLTTTVSRVTSRTGSDSGAVAMTEKGYMTEARSATLHGTRPIKYYKSEWDCLDAVKKGEVSSTDVYTYSAQQYLDQDASGSLMAVLLPQYHISFSLGVAYDEDPRLLTILDKAVNYVNGNIVHEIILKQTEAPRHSLTFADYLRENPVLLMGMIIGLGLLIGLTAALLYRRKAVRLIEAKNVELNSAIEQANKANQAKTAFLSSMSHDMRTPLNGIIGFTDFALRTDDPVKKQEYLTNVQKSSSVLLSLINDTLDVSRIESGKVQLNPEYVSAQSIFDNLCLVIASSAAQKHIRFISKLNVTENIEVNIDKLKLQEIFMNLLSNAIKFTPDGGTVSFIVEETGMHDAFRDFKFEIRDTGIGMSREFQEQMYEPFAQEHSSQNGSGTGTGLGLYITKRFIDLMHGSIRVQSEPGNGTAFEVYISAESRIGGTADRETAGLKPYDFTGKCIMIVEDNAFNSEIARTLLEHVGARTVVAENGQQAVNLFEDEPAGTFSAILMDVHMPVMGGYEATRKIRQMGKPDAATVPIIAMTADAYDEDVQNCLKAGMNSHIAKPIDTAVMFSEIDRFLSGMPS